MNTAVQIIGGLLFSGMAVLFLYSLYGTLRRWVATSGPVVETEAMLIRKTIRRDEEGGFGEEFLLTFQLAHGPREDFAVSRDMYEMVPGEGTPGTLYYQGYVFKGFRPKAA
ncbi:MAG TPA: DUF2500 family protein [Symbiobacteriaceae bacterium]|nr:DUF2500 family protein [Symbiobacteriaceae bacterium]